MVFVVIQFVDPIAGERSNSSKVVDVKMENLGNLENLENSVFKFYNLHTGTREVHSNGVELLVGVDGLLMLKLITFLFCYPTHSHDHAHSHAHNHATHYDSPLAQKYLINGI